MKHDTGDPMAEHPTRLWTRTHNGSMVFSDPTGNAVATIPFFVVSAFLFLGSLVAFIGVDRMLPGVFANEKELMQNKGHVCFFSVSVIVELTLVFCSIHRIIYRRYFIIVLGPRKLFLWTYKRPTIAYYSDIKCIKRRYWEVYIHGRGFPKVDATHWFRRRADREFFVSELTRRVALSRQEKRQQN